MRNLILVMMLGCSCPALADEVEMERFRDFLPAQIVNIGEEERKQSVPIAYINAANLALSSFGPDIIQAQLNSLMYSGLADYSGAKRAFQADLGQAVTGELTVGQIHELGYRSERIGLQYVNFFSYGYIHTITETSATLRGTVQIIGETIAYPINYVTIRCFKVQAYCSYNQVALIVPDRNSWTQTYSVSEIADEFYRITRWEGNQIDATPVTENRCRTNRLTFNFGSEEFFEVVTNNVAGECKTDLGIAIPPLQQPRISKIIDGTKVIDGEFKRIQDEASSYYASAFRRGLQQKYSKTDRAANASSR